MSHAKHKTISWDDLHLVKTIAEEGSMSSAAQKMNVNASTIGRRLDALEEQWQTRIFDRTNRGIENTELTEKLLPFVEIAEQAVHGFIQTLEGNEQEAEGTVTISAPPGIASFFLAPRLYRIRQQNPRIQIQLDAETDFADLARREADIAFRTHRPQNGNLVATKIFTEQSTVMAHPDYCKNLGRICHWKQLEWITWGKKLAHLENYVWISQRVPEHSIVLRSDSFDVLVQAATSRVGAMLITKTLGREMGLEEVKMQPVLQKELTLLSKTEIWMTGHSALRNVPRIAAIWTAILESVGRDY